MKTHSGSCLCGQVSYVLRGEPENQGHCHCIACKKATSAPFATLVYYKEENFEKKLARRVFINIFLIKVTL